MKVVHADDHLIVLDKPTGLPSVSLRAEEDATAAAWAAREFPGLLGVARAVGRPLEAGLVHRLDGGTSGLLAFARTEEDYLRLRGLWKTPAVSKIYRALISGEPPLPRLPMPIHTPLGHSAKSSRRMLAVLPGRESQVRGKALEARTELISARRVETGASTRVLYDAEVRIQTGVRHQIRCHLSSIGWPIVGDKLYRGPESDRLWLHAWKLVLPAPDGGSLELVADLPAGWPKDE
jgi:23S rRNA-/tRNA-specific pseudouridylate synthase